MTAASMTDLAPPSWYKVTDSATGIWVTVQVDVHMLQDERWVTRESSIYPKETVTLTEFLTKHDGWRTWTFGTAAAFCRSVAIASVEALVHEKFTALANFTMPDAVPMEVYYSNG